MTDRSTKNKLKLYHQGQLYNWSDLLQRIELISPCISPVTITPQDRFNTLIYLLYGFINKVLIAPINTTLKTNITIQSLSQNDALAIATSGTQSEPKIILLSRDNIRSHCYYFNQIVPLDRSSLWLNCMPLNHIAGVMIVYRCWFQDASMILHDEFNAQQVWSDLQRYAVTHISLVPRMLQRLLECSQNTRPPESLKSVIVGGDKLADALLEKAIFSGWPIILSYGMTEACSTIALGKSTEQLIPLDGFKLQIDKKNTLQIAGAMIAKKFVSHNNEVNSEHLVDGWFSTHDQVHWDGQCLSFIARNDDMIISGGENISPQYLEDLLLKSPFIDDIAIGKINDEKWGDTIVALVCGDLNAFKAWIKLTIQSMYRPRYFLAVNEIPRNALGKIDRLRIKKMIADSFNNDSIEMVCY
ncbi:AMP-binding protein [sulfur-oxidizing endosymbiont of Gigantopelta aegis]|uniref:AMP-binding protein n=1 Tax=sulfur-oxidizing endosymbiont of Gigantopelta aegis TaxID=2794934 RepID=UPI0018DD9B86|nr:AMP-binding protein [sulfur-oxidizing endosymbiont of Gigantopelta aegis]